MNNYTGVVFDKSKRVFPEEEKYTWLPWLVEYGVTTPDDRTIAVLRKRLMDFERDYPLVSSAVKEIFYKGVNGMVGAEDLAVLPVLVSDWRLNLTPAFLLIYKYNNFNSYVLPIAPVTESLYVLRDELDVIRDIPKEDHFFVSWESLNLSLTSADILGEPEGYAASGV